MKIDKKTIVALVICLLIVGATTYFLFFHTEKQGDEADANANTEKTGTDTGSTAANNSDYAGFPLMVGSRGANVKTLQKKMNEWMAVNWFTLQSRPLKTKISEDGVFGNKTLEFVKIIFKYPFVGRDEFNQFITSSTTTKEPWKLF
ncbi:MAG TPA: hypothetical protein VK152_11610 [Paludibacter sp.]|nr:hypothetical protein [Paludibacter sp.]